jgi:hypothetical protein
MMSKLVYGGHDVDIDVLPPAALAFEAAVADRSSRRAVSNQTLFSVVRGSLT